jgi:ferric-dicitrate binding protein FerR (iron transport regulator)
VRPPIEESLAAGERIEGQPVVRRQIDGERRVLRLSLQMPLRADDTIETDQGSRAALGTADGSSIRLDRSSHARLIGPRVIELVQGGVYIATSDGSKGFEVRTPLGSVHDVGTRFEVRLAETSLRVRVRAGSVEIRRRDQIVPASAGTEATVTPGGIETRRTSTYGAEWEWTAGLAAPFAIEGRSLSVYLEHLAHEQGWTLRYADPALAEAASTIVLQGSVEGLGAEEALSVTLRTSGLEYRLRGGDLVVSRGGAQ